MDSKKIQTSKNCITANSLGTYASKGFSASLKCLTSIGFMMICTMTAWADGSGNCGNNTEGNVKWEFTSSTGTLRIYPNTTDPNGTDFAMADYEWSNRTDVPWNDYKNNITSVVIEDGVTTIGGYNFFQLTALTSVSIGKDVTTIGTYDCAFEGCTALTSITIPASVTTIGAFAFRNCTNLADITFTKEENITSIDGSAFNSTAWLNAQPDGVVYLGKVAYGFKENSTNLDVTITDGTVAIASRAFNGTYISSVTIPNSVTYIGKEAFNNCALLTTVYVLPATPPELYSISHLFTGDDGEVNTNQKFFVHGNGYNSGKWKDLWEDMKEDTNNDWNEDNNITIIGTVTTPEGITASGTPTVSHSGIDYYKKGETITLTGGTNYVVTKTSDGTDVTSDVLSGTTLTMPAYDVTVSVTTDVSLTANEATLSGVTKYWTTFYHPSLSYQLPEGAQAFYMKSDHVLYLVGDGDIIPTDTPVIIMSDTASITLTKVNDIDLLVSGNILQGTSTATAVGSLSLTEGQKVYVLSKVGNDFGFFEFEGTIPANKAYINEE